MDVDQTGRSSGIHWPHGEASMRESTSLPSRPEFGPHALYAPGIAPPCIRMYRQRQRTP